MNQLPNDSQSQEIGRLAQRALSTKIPRAWIETPMSGDSDYGIDYQVQLKNSYGQVEYSFYLQLKGTTNPSLNADGTLSFAFRCSTLNFYHSQEPLVMVAVVNLKGNMDEVYNCPIYYLWLDDEWFKKHEDKLMSQDSITLRIPTEQLLTTKLDVYDFYKNRFNERMALTALSRQIKPHTDDVIGTIGNITNTITNKPFFLKAMEHNGDEPWVENPDGFYPTELKRIETNLINNRLASAGSIIEDLEQHLDSMDSHEKAELMYQKANFVVLLDKLNESTVLYKKASELSGKIRYLVAYLESKLRAQPCLEARNILEVLSEHPNKDKRIIFIKVKCMALIGRGQEAINLINENHPDYILAKLMVHTIVDDKEQLDALLDSINIDSLKSVREKVFVHFLIGRRAYLKANNEAIKYDEIVPIYGLPNADIVLMQSSYKHYQQAWKLTEELGYPQDFTLLLDISPLVFTYFNNISELFRHFDNVLRERPEHSEVINVYSRLAFNKKEYHKTITLLRDGNNEIELEDHVLIFLSYYYLRKYSEALKVFNSIADDILKSSLINKTMLFCIASEVAKELFENELADNYMACVQMHPDADAIIALAKFIKDSEESPGDLKIHSNVLYEKYIELGRPLFLAEQLISNLQMNSREDADKIIDVATIIVKDHELSVQDDFYYANALITNRYYEKALSIIDKIMQKEQVDTNWHLLKAFALHNNGEPGKAIDCLSDVLHKPPFSNDILKMYIQLCIQFGMADEVEKTILELISKSNHAPTKVQYLIQLFNIYSKSEVNQIKRLPVLRQIGKLVNQDDCDEEGSFLMLVLTSQRTEDEQEFTEWQQRLVNYTTKFPNSSRLKRAEVNPDAPAEEFLDALNKLTGVTPEMIQVWENNRLQIRDGSLIVPFAMRGHLLRATRDVFTTWSLSKSSSEEAFEFKIRHASMCPQSDFDILVDNSSSFILEETTLLILSELNILDNFLNYINNFSLLSITFNNVSKHAQQYIQSDTSAIAKKIMLSINTHRSKLKIIDCSANIIEGYTDAVVGKDCFLLTDDLDMQGFVQATTSNKFSANSINVISFLTDRKMLTHDEAYGLIAKLCGLGINKINMSVSLLSSIYYHYCKRCDNYDIFSTDFSKIYNNVFSSSKNKQHAQSVLIRMVVTAFNIEQKLPSSRVLLALFRVFIERHPISSLNRLLTLWFIAQCTFILNGNVDDISEYSIECNQKVFEFYKGAICSVNLTYDDDDLITEIMDALRNCSKEKQHELFIAVKRCFEPLTRFTFMLESKYQSMRFNEQYKF